MKNKEELLKLKNKWIQVSVGGKAVEGLLFEILATENIIKIVDITGTIHGFFTDKDAVLIKDLGDVDLNKPEFDNVKNLLDFV